MEGRDAKARATPRGSARPHNPRLPANHPSSDGTPSGFVPVTVLPDPILATAAVRQPLELCLNNGRRIAVAPGFDPLTLRQLIALVEEPPCSG